MVFPFTNLLLILTSLALVFPMTIPITRTESELTAKNSSQSYPHNTFYRAQLINGEQTISACLDFQTEFTFFKSPNCTKCAFREFKKSIDCNSKTCSTFDSKYYSGSSNSLELQGIPIEIELGLTSDQITITSSAMLVEKFISPPTFFCDGYLKMSEVLDASTNDFIIFDFSEESNEISFVGKDSIDFKKILVSFPVHKDFGEYSFNIGVNSLFIGEEEIKVDTNAALSLSTSFIGLPKAAFDKFKEILNKLGFKCSEITSNGFPSIKCSAVKFPLKNLPFGISFTDFYQDSLLLDIHRLFKQCNKGKGENEFSCEFRVIQTDKLIFGEPFFQGCHVIFDWTKKKIAFVDLYNYEVNEALHPQHYSIFMYIFFGILLLVTLNFVRIYSKRFLFKVKKLYLKLLRKRKVFTDTELSSLNNPNSNNSELESNVKQIIKEKFEGKYKNERITLDDDDDLQTDIDKAWEVRPELKSI